MNTSIILTFFLSLCLVVNHRITTTTDKNSDGSFAVVELFTSEGCSSCPAADELLKEMTGILQNEGKQVIALSFHVTYWNRLGWVDPFSQEQFTERQRKYCQALDVPSTYTPQAVVNGEKEFVGSNPVAFREYAEVAIKRKPAVVIEAELIKEGEDLLVFYTLDKVPKNTVLNIALIERHVERHIQRGENKNRTLKHFNVVRKFETLEPHQKGMASIKPDNDELLLPGSIVVYAQHKNSLKILGAVQINFP